MKPGKISGDFLRAARNLCPKAGGGVTSITIRSAGREPVTLTAETREKLNRRLREQDGPAASGDQQGKETPMAKAKKAGAKRAPETIEPTDVRELFRLQRVADQRQSEYEAARKETKDLREEAESAASEVFSFLRELAGGQKRLPLGDAEDVKPTPAVHSQEGRA